MSIKSFVTRKPLTAYFGLTLGWIGGYTLLAYRFIPPDMPDGLGSVPPWLMILLMFGMPSVIGLALTALSEGKSGVKTLLARLGLWRVPTLWLLLAALIPLFAYGSAYLLQSLLGGPAPALRLALLAAGIGSGLFSAPFEELGWRGFVLPRLLNRCSPLKAALLTGLGWGAWHFLLNYIGMRQYGSWMFLTSFLAGPVLLTGLTVLMTWIYLRTRGSLLVMVLFHLSITTSGLFLGLSAPTTIDAIRQFLVIDGVIWLIASAVIVLGGLNAGQPFSGPAHPTERRFSLKGRF